MPRIHIVRPAVFSLFFEYSFDWSLILLHEYTHPRRLISDSLHLFPWWVWHAGRTHIHIVYKRMTDVMTIPHKGYIGYVIAYMLYLSINLIINSALKDKYTPYTHLYYNGYRIFTTKCSSSHRPGIFTIHLPIKTCREKNGKNENISAFDVVDLKFNDLCIYTLTVYFIWTFTCVCTTRDKVYKHI